MNWLMWLTDCGPSVEFQLVTALRGIMPLPVVALDVEQAQDPAGRERSWSSATSRITWYWSFGFLIR